MKEVKINKITKIGWIVWFLILLVIIIVALTDYDVNYRKKAIEEFKNPYVNIEYEIIMDSYCSCLTFSDKGFSEYDCDSEVSEMPFSGEFYNKYSYDEKNKIITFKGENMFNVRAKVLNWTEDEFEIQVLNGLKSNKRCSANGYNIYKYYATNIYKMGDYVKEFIIKLDDDGVDIRYYGDDGHLYTTNKKCKEDYNNSDEIDYYYYNSSNDDCGNGKYRDIKDIVSEIKDSIEYNIVIGRNKDGSIKLVYVDVEEE